MNNPFKRFVLKYTLLICVVMVAATNPGHAQNKLNLKTDSGQSIPDTLLFRMQKAQAAITEINAAVSAATGRRR